ncbi:MAG: flagellar hook-length control protein FliK [Clostridiaceae bacterium]|nr:flagellar hook-length control protein FliK [Clostridiaceae bacterium]
MRIDASRVVLIKPELLELLKNLEVGDTLKGRVLEALGSSIAIRTASGQVFTALLQEGTKIPKGAFVELIVSSIADGKVFAELKGESKASDLDTKVSEFLRQVSLPVDEKNVEAAKLLIKYKLPLDKDAIINITGLQKSIDNLNQGVEERVGLLISGLDIKNTTVDVLNKLVLSWSDDLVNQEVEKVVSEKTGNNASGIIVSEEAVQDTEKPAAAVTNQPSVKADNNDENKENLKEIVNILKPVSTEVHKEVVRYKEPIMEEGAQTTAKDNTAALDDNKGAALLRVLDRLGIETGSEVKRFAGQVTDILTSIKSSDMEAITYLVSKAMKITPRNLDMLIKNIENSDGISQFLDKLQQRIADKDNPELKLIKDSIKKIFLEPRQIEDGKEVSLQLKDIAKLGEKLERYLLSSDIKDPEIRDALSNLKDSIDFIRNVNQHNNFLQIPIMINEDTSTAKLYVFKEGKRNKPINPEDATVVVVLDLKSLGHLESMIRVKGKAVNVTFKVENKGIGTFIEKNIHLLKGYLGEKGYNLGPIRVISMEQPFSLLSLEAMINERGTEKIHFDMRV